MRHSFLIAAAALTALGLCGCATSPTDPVRQRAVTQALTATEGTWPTDEWWKAYGDPQLDQLIAEALTGSPSLALAKARVKRATAMNEATRADLWPSFGASGAVEAVKQSYNFGFPKQFVPKGYNDLGRVTLNFDWELDFWGKTRAAVAAATSEAKAAAADAALARLMLTTNIASDYAVYGRLVTDREITLQALKAREETLALVGQRVDNGLDTQAELMQARAGPPATRAELAALDEDIALTRNALASLVGAGPDRGLALQTPGTVKLKPFGLPPRLAADLIGRRPDLAAARWRAMAAARRIDQAKAAFYPDINLAAYFGGEALHLSQVFAQGSDIGQFGPAISLPIFQAGRLRAGVRGARAERDMAVAAYDVTLVQALREVADVTVSERALGVRLRESQAALSADEGAFTIAKLRYHGGLSTYQAVLLSQEAVLAQRRTVADLEGRALALDIELVRALGGGFVAGPS